MEISLNIAQNNQQKFKNHITSNTLPPSFNGLFLSAFVLPQYLAFGKNKLARSF